MKARLIGSRELAPGVRHFQFDVPEVEEFSFVPGQFVSFKHLFGEREIIRAYSIASSPEGNRFDLCLNLAPDGIFSTYLFSLPPDSEVEIAPPLGYFTLRNPHRNLILVATGTGIAPFRSILQTQLHQLDTNIVLLFGTRYEHSILYHDEWRELESRYPNFRFWPTLTRPTSEWTGRTGRIHTHLEEAVAGRTDCDVYLCGLKEMVDDARAFLKGRGFDRKQIIYEKYD